MSHQEKQRIFDRISIEKWKLNFKDFLSGTINEVHGEVLSTQDAIIQIEEIVFAACDLVQEEQQKRIAENAELKEMLCHIGTEYEVDKSTILNPENKTMYKDLIEKYVKEWMDGHEPDTFIKNEHGVYLYTAGPASINLKLFFESLLEDFIEDKIDKDQLFKLKSTLTNK